MLCGPCTAHVHLGVFLDEPAAATRHLPNDLRHLTGMTVARNEIRGRVWAHIEDRHGKILPVKLVRIWNALDPDGPTPTLNCRQ